MTFASSKIERTGDNALKVEGDITLRGITAADDARRDGELEPSRGIQPGSRKDDCGLRSAQRQSAFYKSARPPKRRISDDVEDFSRCWCNQKILTRAAAMVGNVTCTT